MGGRGMFIACKKYIHREVRRVLKQDMRSGLEHIDRPNLYHLSLPRA